jgi:HAD superfamily hydrolase (TIGR01509 family)
VRGIPEAAIARAKEERDKLYQQYLATEDIEVEGVLEVLKALQGRYRMAIVSTAKRADFEVIHRARQLVPLFEFVLTREDYARAKPVPDPYQQALWWFGAAPAEAIVIEDSARGLRAAVADGVDCIVVRNEFTATQDFTGAWRMIGSLRELPAVLIG